MYMPAEYYNEKYRGKNDDYEGFTFGDECSSSEDDDDNDYHATKPIERPKSPPLDNINLLDERLYSSLMNDDADKLDNLLKIHIKRDLFRINAPLQNGYSMLMSACQNAQYDIVNILLKYGANPNQHVELHSPIMEACKSTSNMNNSLRIVEKFIEIGVAVNQSNRCGLTPLMFACSSGNADLVKCLIKYADLNTADNQGNTALFHAVEKNNIDVVRILLNEKNVQTKLTNVAGYTPSQLAMFGGFDEIFKLFPNKNVYTIPTEYLTNNHYEDMAPTIHYQNKPAYFMDVRALLFGMECEKFLANFAQAGIGLPELLNITDDHLNDIGISLPFEKKRLYLGLWKFHKYQWSPYIIKSVVNKAKKYSNVYDIYCLFAIHLRYLIVLRESLRYVCDNIGKRRQGIITEEIATEFDILSKEIREVLNIITNFKRTIQYFEKYQTPKPPLYIENKPSTISSTSRIGKTIKTILKCSTGAIGFGYLIVYLMRRR